MTKNRTGAQSVVLVTVPMLLHTLVSWTPTSNPLTVTTVRQVASHLRTTMSSSTKTQTPKLAKVAVASFSAGTVTTLPLRHQPLKNPPRLSATTTRPLSVKTVLTKSSAQSKRCPSAPMPPLRLISKNRPASIVRTVHVVASDLLAALSASIPTLTPKLSWTLSRPPFACTAPLPAPPNQPHQRLPHTSL